MSIEGLNELVGDLTRAGLTAGARAEAVLDRVADDVADTAEDLAPKGTRPHADEDLAPSIHVTGSGGVREIGPSARHGLFMEEGTYKDPPQPYMGPALDQRAPEFEREMEELGGDV